MSGRKDVWHLPVSLTAADVARQMHYDPAFAFEVLIHLSGQSPNVFAAGCDWVGGDGPLLAEWLSRAANDMDSKLNANNSGPKP